ncbi:hypothetical protein PV326_000527 [Microctonus aethiopoides]|nr:hypothetical protein PV326_000527 [Microctonus aethiopoides]
MDNNTEEFDSQSILYELLEYFVKKQEPELIRCKNDSIILPSTGTIKNALRYLNNRYSLPESLSQQISLTLPWKFAIGDSGRILAILQENVIEFRKLKDEFSSIAAKASVSKDAFPQWRKIEWSPDGSILVLASSNGYLSFYNSSGSNLYNISPKTVSQNPDILEVGDAISSLTFHSPKSETDNWSYELLIVTYSGLLKSFNISTSHGFKKNYEFSFGNFYRKGVNAFAYDKKHNIYIVAGNSITQYSLSPASKIGLTSWRPINDYPYYKLSFAFDENSGSPTLSLWNLIPNFKRPQEPVIFRLSISPSCEHLVCLHTDGSISIWNLPNLQLKKKWKLNEQPDYNNQNPLTVSKQKKFPIGHSEFSPLDIGWWSDNAIIIARYSGAISVCSINDLKNLLGTSPEFLYGQPQISELYSGNGCLCLDCEIIVVTKKRDNEPNNDGQISEASDSEKEEDELEPLTFMNYVTNLLRIVLYSITDIETFQPKRKKSKIVQRTYRILGMKSTTPEELYSRKIDIEEYDEALTLANAYKLDTDLVYQTQWRKSSFSLQAIQEHLSKVRKRSWILNECVMRVPETLEAARELLNFGLKGANLQTFLTISDSDDGKIVIEDTDDDDILQSDDATANLRHIQKINEILKGIDLTSLSNSQKTLLVYRKNLLDHLDKLKTYEMIIEKSTEYKRESYEKFRQLTILENAVNFARDCNYRAVEILFTYHGQKLIPHWLAIISCFPETLNPNEYEKLLPECDDNGQLFLLYQRELRPKDWLEKNEFEFIFDKNNNDGSDILYETDPNLSIYNNSEITMELLCKWYKWRAYQIERQSYIVENALELIKIAKSHNITGLENFLLELETLDDLVYKIQLENMSLAKLEELSNIEKVKLLMSTATEENFVMHIKNFVLPYINRKQKYLGGAIDKILLKDYLITLSENDLTLPLKFFNHLQQDIDILNMVDDIMELALNCIYACTNPDMYQMAKNIFETLPKLQSSRDAFGVLNPLEELERELECLKILNKHNVNTTLSFIHKNKMNKDKVKLLLHDMANSLNEITPPASQEKWSELLNDMLELQEFIFSCINIEVCFEICVQTRLSSGIKINIQNCKLLIETKRNEHSLLKVSYDKAVELILQASRDYFNTSRSLNDSNMELSKACLNLIEDENSLIQMEFELIYSLQILNEFNIDILPMQVRLCQDRLKLIENCLNNRHDSYKRQQRLLMLATYLRIEGDNIRSREGKVLELVAKKAFDAEDYNDCSLICQKLINNNYFIAWRIIKQLGCCDNYNDLIFRQRCLSFAMTYGPNEILEETLCHMHQLEIQLLNKNLQNFMTTREFEISSINNDDSDDEFTDAMTTPQTEVKEFVPKILETSSGIVKSSAQIVKNSTIEILKNVSNQSFWKKALNINSRNVQDISIDNENDNEQEENHDEVQSFPFFYQSLHSNSNINISRVDTKYDRYSMPDINNTSLKICQTLLRITLLTETSSYGSEVSDINHFLVQSARNIMSDDWLLGMAYLLNLNNTNATRNIIDEFFANMPRTDLFIQTAMYYYSLELYRQINPNLIDYFSYDPMDLIQKMVAEAKVIVNDETDHNETKKALIYWYEQLSTIKTSEIKAAAAADDEDEMPKEHIESQSIETNLNDSESQDIPRDRGGDDDDLKTKNLYDNDAFKITSRDDGEDNVDVDEASGWDDNWSDFSNGGDDDVQDKSLLLSTNNLLVDLDEHNSESLEKKSVVETNGDEKNTSEDAMGDWFDESNWSTVVDDTTESERFEIWENLFSQMETRDDYIKLKRTLIQWPAFVESEFTTLEKHPILRMLLSVKLYVKEKVDSKCQTVTLQEYKELLKGQNILPNVFVEFVKQLDENSSSCGVEEKIFFRLCTDNTVLHQEAIDIMKNDKSKVDYSPLILEELFFKDLTALFPPHHHVYNKIVEVMFLNYKLPEIEKHIRILIDKLIEQKHIPYAIALWNQLAAIPSVLSTFESCFQLYIKK